MDGPKGEDGESPALTRNCNSDEILQHLESQDARLDRVLTSLAETGWDRWAKIKSHTNKAPVLKDGSFVRVAITKDSLC